MGWGETKSDYGGEGMNGTRKGKDNGLKLPTIDPTQVRKAVNTKIKALEDNEELLNWSLALDFDEYDTNWTRLGTSLPSSSQPQAFYK